jgi:exopolysaccharide biosynthesis polyprenyl glycosylphosphotransferase
MPLTKEKIILLASDFIAVNISYVIYYQLRFRSGLFPVMEDVALVVPSLLVSIYWLVLFALRGHYRTLYVMSRFDAFASVVKTTFVGVLVLFIVFSPAEHPFHATRLIIAAYWGLLIFTAGGARVLIRTVQGQLLSRGIGHRNTLVIGSGPGAEDLIRYVKRHPVLGYNIVGYVDGESSKSMGGGIPNLGARKDLREVLSKYDIREAIVALSHPDHRELLSIIGQCSLHNVRVKAIPDLFEILSGRARTQQIWGMPLIEVSPELMAPWQKVAKEFLDVLASLIMLILAMPVMIVVAIAIAVDSKGGVFYKQLRVGRGGKEFTLIKFRSMFLDAESRTGAVWAGKNDPRITRVGRVVRSLRLDEVPQLINVLKGEMSLVGPRPERPVFVKKFIDEIPFYARRLNVKPGITGWAQVKHKYDESLEDVRTKLRYDLFYIENMSLRLDLKILLATMWVVLRGKGQ